MAVDSRIFCKALGSSCGHSGLCKLGSKDPALCWDGTPSTHGEMERRNQVLGGMTTFLFANIIMSGIRVLGMEPVLLIVLKDLIGI